MDVSFIGGQVVPKILRFSNDFIFGVKQSKFLVIKGVANYTYGLTEECNRKF